MNKIEVFSTLEKYDFLVGDVLKKTKKVFKVLKKDGYQVSLFLISNPQIKKINKIYRGKDKATNVLSFVEPKDFIQKTGKFKNLGEIYIAFDYVKKLKQEVDLMIVHGVLHLFGFDHENLKDAQKMEKKEKFILEKI